MTGGSRKGILRHVEPPDNNEENEVGRTSQENRSFPPVASIPERLPTRAFNVINPSSSSRRVDLDDLFPYIGEYGKYQKLLTWLIVLPACIPCGLQGFNQLFMADDLPHWCRLPQILHQRTNFTLDQLKRLALPQDPKTNGTSQCTIRSLNWTLLVEDGMKDFEEMLDVALDTDDMVSPCLEGWDYDMTQVTSSIVSDFDLVCGKEIYPTIALFLVNVGGLFGVFLFGLLSDIIGRKLAFFACLTFEMIGGVGCVFARDFWVWTFFRVITGVTVPAIYQIPFIICLELVGPSYRAFVTVMTSLFYVAGLMLLPLIAWLERDWRIMSLYTTVPFSLYYIYFWFLPESPRWLLAQKRVKEALKILEALAQVNGKKLPTHLVDRIGFEDRRQGKDSAGSRHTKGILDLFRTPNLRLKTLLLTLCWFANCTVYVGLSYYGPALGDNPYFSFFLGSAIELPGYILCWIVMDRCGRRGPLSFCMIFGGIFASATCLLPEDSTTLLMTFYLISKFGISASYLIIYPFAGELYPTEVRGLGLGFSAYIGGIGICCIPLINYLGRTNLVLPLIVMGAVSVVGGLAGLRLPDTLNAPLPQTVEEGEEFGKKFTWRDCIRCSGPER
ncbi:unnamed protein product [Allacma fusca]|uniref:Major facilitator superfamily (MFS) profile domain-containing protein n=1 Tax=Allacma fusca TaxID=39272 RepID=A0A8J2KFM5_9HEXA|nr:unnamed protein product [Allacma fusca]